MPTFEKGNMISLILIKADTPEEIEAAKSKLLGTDSDEYSLLYVSKKYQKYRKLQTDENEKLLFGNFRYGVDTFLDSDLKYFYFMERLPENPGVYFFFDEHDAIVYIGSAKNLLKRVPKSFRERNGRQIVRYIAYIRTHSENEARQFEATMINKYKPSLNKKIPWISSTLMEFVDIYGIEWNCVLRSRK